MMVKKIVLIGGGTMLIGLLVFGRGAVSYVRTSAGYMTDSMKDAVPVEFEIQRARGMIKDLVPEVRKNMHLIAKEEVEVKRLEEQIAQAEERLSQEKGQLMRLKADLTTGRDVFRYAGRSYTEDQVRHDLANRFERYKTGDATLESLQKIYRARQQSLGAARDKLEGMLASKRQMQVEVENLEARLQMLEAAQATSEYQFDDSRLGRLKELVQDLHTRLDVADNLVNAESRFHDEIPLDAVAPENIVDEVTQYFATPQATDDVAKLADATKK